LPEGHSSLKGWYHLESESGGLEEKNDERKHEEALFHAMSPLYRPSMPDQIRIYVAHLSSMRFFFGCCCRFSIAGMTRLLVSMATAVRFLPPGDTELG